jgi:hypothetical protein
MRTALALLIVLPATALAAPAAPAPRSFVSAMKDYGCDKTAWTKLPDDTWLARCDTAATSSHNAVLFHHAGSAATFEIVDLADWTTQKATRGMDFDEGATFVVKGTTISLERHGLTGDLRRDLWEVAAFPPKLLSHADGGGATWSNAKAPSFPACLVDFGKRTETCEEELPSCDAGSDASSDGWYGDKVKYATVPAVDHLPADPFACSASLGGFEAVAEATQLLMSKPRQLVVHLRGPAAAKWNLWLARSGTAVAAWRDDRAGYCKARADEVQVTVVDGKLAKPVKGASVKAEGAGLAITLDDPLASWAMDGAISVGVGDAKPAALGRLGSDRLCPAPPVSVSTHVWP